jgi:hypothetical protein
MRTDRDAVTLPPELASVKGSLPEFTDRRTPYFYPDRRGQIVVDPGWASVWSAPGTSSFLGHARAVRMTRLTRALIALGLSCRTADLVAVELSMLHTARSGKDTIGYRDALGKADGRTRYLATTLPWIVEGILGLTQVIETVAGGEQL